MQTYSQQNKPEIDPALQLFVGGLPKKASNDSLQEYFETFGQIVECRIVTDKVTQQSRGFAFVTFTDAKAFEKAVYCKTHKYLKATISVKPAMSKNESEQINMEEKERKLFIVGIPHKTRQQDLVRLFQKYGEIETIEMKAHRGFGFIQFKDRVSVIDVLGSQEQFMIEDKLLEIRPVLHRNELSNLKSSQQTILGPPQTSEQGMPNLLLLLDGSKSNQKSLSRHSDQSAEEVETRPRNRQSLQQLIAMNS